MKMFYFHSATPVHPKRRLTEDGLRLSKHLRNRGRPTNSTWAKYKAQGGGGGKKVERNSGMIFSFIIIIFCYMFI